MESPPNEEEAFPTTLKQIKGHFSTVHVVAYICCAIMSRQYSGWQHALFPGFGSFIIAQVLTSFGCICHYLCLMEIWSAVPFSGGNYALSRATLGFYLGFLDGVMEALVYITHSSISALSAGGRLCIIFDLKPDHATLFTFLLYLAAVCFAVQTNLYVLRRSFMIFGTLGLVILLIYCFGSLKWSNFMENASLHKAEPASHVDNWFQGGWVEWIKILPWTLQPYAGIRSFTLLTGMTKNPKTTLPRATLTAFSLIIAVHILVIFVFASEPGGIEYTSNQLLPSKTGWSLIFNMSDETNTKIANILSLPATFGRVFAYLIPGAMLLHSMGQSNLMPSILMVNHSKNHTTGVLISAILGMFIAVVNYYYGPIIEVFNLAVMGTMITDCTFLYGYILLKTTYSTVPREFVSPFGLFGAIFSIVMYVLIFISSAFYQNDYFALKFLAVLLGILTVYYFGFASRSQTLCEEEDQVFMKMHVRNYNKAKKTKQHRLKRNQNHAAAAVVPTGWRGMLHWLTRCCRVGGAARVADSGQGGSDSLESGAVVPEPTCVTPPVMFSSSIIGTTLMPTINSSTVTGTTTAALGATAEKYQLILDSSLVIAESGKADLKDKVEEEEQTDGVELGVLSHSGRDELNKLPMLAESVSVHSQKTAE